MFKLDSENVIKLPVEILKSYRDNNNNLFVALLQIDEKKTCKLTKDRRDLKKVWDKEDIEELFNVTLEEKESCRLI